MQWPSEEYIDVQSVSLHMCGARDYKSILIIYIYPIIFQTLFTDIFVCFIFGTFNKKFVKYWNVGTHLLIVLVREALRPLKISHMTRGFDHDTIHLPRPPLLFPAPVR